MPDSIRGISAISEIMATREAVNGHLVRHYDGGLKRRPHPDQKPEKVRDEGRHNGDSEPIDPEINHIDLLA